VNAKEKIPRVHWKIINIYVGLLKVLRDGKKGSYVAQSIHDQIIFSSVFISSELYLQRTVWKI
jgi:hypothetical protein